MLTINKNFHISTFNIKKKNIMEIKANNFLKSKARKERKIYKTTNKYIYNLKRI
jgi:hypothetical protein